MDTFSIRTATIIDAKEIAEVYVRSWSETYKDIINEESIRRECDLENRIKFFESLIQCTATDVFVIEKKGSIIGLLVLKSSRSVNDSSLEVELVAIYILPEFWRNGFGSSAIDFLRVKYPNEFIEDSYGEVKTVRLWVLEENNSARQFYERMGFSITEKCTILRFGKQAKKAIQYVVKW